MFRGDEDVAAVERLGEDVRRARLLTGLSQAALAARVGVHQTTILRLEHGRAPGTRVVIYARIREELGMDRPCRDASSAEPDP
jgi:transcriptional regulator with XRE-family HTH domain